MGGVVGKGQRTKSRGGGGGKYHLKLLLFRGWGKKGGGELTAWKRWQGHHSLPLCEGGKALNIGKKGEGGGKWGFSFPLLVRGKELALEKEESRP